MLPVNPTALQVQPQPTKPPERYEPIVPPFDWVPPVWEDGQPPPSLSDGCLTVATEPNFERPTPLNCITGLAGDLDDLRALGGGYKDILMHVQACRELEASAGEEPLSDDPQHPDKKILRKLPYPEDNFDHDEPADFDSVEAPSVEAPGSHRLDPPRGSRKAMEHPYGWPRLQLVFEHTLCKVTTALGQINAALDAGDAGDYMIAREAYIQLLRDLDDHEPDDVEPGEKGYGRSLKWFYVQPVIFKGRIYGTNVMAKWNPHFSSSGIPIPHQ